MVIQNKDNLSLILNLPGKDILVGKLKFKCEKITFKKRIAELYMKSIGFTPYMQGDKYVVYEAEYYNNGEIKVYKRYKQGSSYSYKEDIDITNADFLTVDNLLDGYTFVLSNYDGKTVDINKYMIVKMGEDDFSIECIDRLLLTFKDRNLAIYRGDKEVFIEDTETFFDGVYYWQDYIFDKVQALIFDSFAEEKGFTDIYRQYKDFVRDEPSVTYYNALRYYYYVGQLDFYLLAEFFIKNELKELKKHNPIFTGKPIEKPSDIPMLSKLGMEIYKKYSFSENEDVLFKMEADLKIGTSGLKIIYECIDSINKVKAGYNSIFYTGNERYLFKQIYFILKKFDITPKNLMDRLVRSMFNEHVSIDKYTDIIVDYVKMGESLNVELSNKIPTDVIRLHDLFSDQIQFIKDAETEAAFAEAVIQNNRLLTNLPASNDFTIISPQDPGDLIQEGLILNHCVGSYINRYATGYSKIFFVRRKSLEDQPFVTIELDRNNNLVQMSARSNQQPAIAVVDFVNNWTNKIK